MWATVTHKYVHFLLYGCDLKWAALSDVDCRYSIRKKLYCNLVFIQTSRIGRFDYVWLGHFDRSYAVWFALLFAQYFWNFERFPTKNECIWMKFLFAKACKTMNLVACLKMWNEQNARTSLF